MENYSKNPNIRGNTVEYLFSIWNVYLGKVSKKIPYFSRVGGFKKVIFQKKKIKKIV